MSPISLSSYLLRRFRMSLSGCDWHDEIIILDSGAEQSPICGCLKTILQWQSWLYIYIHTVSIYIYSVYIYIQYIYIYSVYIYIYIYRVYIYIYTFSLMILPVKEPEPFIFAYRLPKKNGLSFAQLKISHETGFPLFLEAHPCGCQAQFRH